MRLAIDANYYVYVADHIACHVNKFQTDGTYITRWGSPGSGVGQFANPIGVATDTDGSVFVCDTNNSRIQQYAFLTTGVAALSWGAAKARYR